MRGSPKVKFEAQNPNQVVQEAFYTQLCRSVGAIEGIQWPPK